MLLFEKEFEQIVCISFGVWVPSTKNFGELKVEMLNLTWIFEWELGIHNNDR